MAQAPIQPPAPMMAADRNVKLMDFDGASSIVEFCQHVTMCQLAANWTQPQTAERVKLHLKGKAMLFLRNKIREATPGLDVWNPPEVAGARPPCLRSLLIQRFLETHTAIEQALLKAQLKQEDNEDAASFYDRVEDLQFQLDEDLPAGFRVDNKAAYDIVHDRDVLTAFIGGLATTVRAHVASTKPATKTDARESAIAFEMAHKKAAKLNALETQEPFDLEALAAKIAALTFQRGRGQGNRGRGATRGGYDGGNNGTNKGCEYCGYIGHKIGQCGIKRKDIEAGKIFQQSPYFQPNRIGRGGRGRGRNNGRGYQHRGRGGVYEMQPPQHEQPQYRYQPPQQTQQPQQPQQPPQNPYYDQPGMGAFRFFPTEN